MMKSTIFLVLVLNFFHNISSSKILCIFPTVSKSHWIVGSSIAKGLAENGHDVTIISALSLDKPFKNYREILLEGFVEEYEANSQDQNILDIKDMPLPLMFYILFSWGHELSESVLQHKNVIELMRSDEKFDLIIMENFAMDSLIGFGQFYGAPVISVSTFGASKWTNDLIGNPTPHSYVPHPFLSYTDRMTFSQRLHSFATTIVEKLLMDLFYLPKSRKIYDEHFPGPKPNFYDVYKNVSLVFVNTHFTLGTPRPYLPNIIEIGGIQIDRNIKQLPSDLQAFIDSAEHGVIIFSMGSNIKGTNFPYEKQQSFVRAFSQLKQKVIWKFENETIDNKPDNLLVKKWLPQNDILAHPNVKLFITHGGLLSTTESIYHGVPIVGIPIFGDQELNVAKAELAGWGKKLDYNNITEDNILSVIKHVLEHEHFSLNTKVFSKRYRKQPMTPKETVNYWVDYVISMDGAPHMRSAGQDLNFIEYHMIDVFVVLIVTVLASLVCSWWLTRKIICLIMGFIKRKCNKNLNRPKSD